MGVLSVKNFFVLTVVFILGVGALFFLGKPWEASALIGKKYCDSSSYKKFTFKNGQEFLIPEAYLFDRWGLNASPDVDGKYYSLIAVELNATDGSPNCNNVRGEDSGFIWITIKPYNYQTVFDFHKQKYPYRIDSFQPKFELFRSVDTQNIKDISGKKELLIPKDKGLRQMLFVECLVSGFSYNSGERLGCSVKSKIRKNIMINYGYNHSHLNQYKEIDSVIKSVIESFVVSKNK